MAFLSRRRALTTPAISLIVLLSLLFWVDDALPYFDVSEISYGRFWDRSGWLLTHVIGGSLALLVGPFQFWSGLRQRHMQFHQWTGRLYTVGVALSAATALQLAFHTESWTFGVVLFVGGVFWLVTTGNALLAAAGRHIDIHREWMIRSYMFTFYFVSFRLLLEISWIENLGTDAEVSTTIGWLCWVVPLMGYEFMTRGKRRHEPRQHTESPYDR